MRLALLALLPVAWASQYPVIAQANLLDTEPETRNSPSIAAPEAPTLQEFTGTVAYSHPIELPPGTGSATPNLVLEYLSDVGASEYGWGWRMNLPRIERCTRFGPPDYLSPAVWSDPVGKKDDPDHRFELNGELLVRDQEDDTRFWKRRTDFEQITYRQLTDDWEVSLPDGGKLYFGSRPEAASKLPHPEDIGTFQWRLDEARDAAGNSYVINYLAAEADGETVHLRPHRLQYTMSAGAASADNRRVEFHWGPRAYGTEEADQPISLRAGFPVQMQHRLTAIAVGFSDLPLDHPTSSIQTELWRYELSYASKTTEDDPNTVSENESENPPFSQLSEIRRTSSSESDDLVTSFTYSRPQRGFTAGIPLSFAADLIPEPLLRAESPQALGTSTGFWDIDGDGILDRVSTDRGGAPFWRVSTGLAPDEGGPGYRGVELWRWCTVADENDCTTGIAPETGWLPTNALPFDPSTSYWIVYADLVDINGDGLIDRVVSSGSSSIDWTVWENRGDRFVGPYSWTPPGAGAAPSATGACSYHINCTWQDEEDARGVARLIDVNGDGRPDHLLHGAGNTIWISMNAGCSSSGCGFSPAFEAAGSTASTYLSHVHNQLEFGLGTHARVFSNVADVNGDGFPDTLETTEQPGIQGCLNVGFGTGTQLSVAADTAACRTGGSDWLMFADLQRSTTSFPVPPLGQALGHTTTALLDMNGDGVLDQAHWPNFGENGANLRVALGLGDGGFSESFDWASPAPTNPAGHRSIRLFGTDPGAGSMTATDLLDVDGDGLTDHLVITSGCAPPCQSYGWTYYPSPGPEGLLTSVTSTFGGETTITWTPSAHTAALASQPALPEGNAAEAGREPEVRILTRNRWVVASISIDDGRTGTPDIGHTLEYAEPRWDFEAREWMGFRQVEVFSSGRLTRSLFHQARDFRGRRELEEIVEEVAGGSETVRSAILTKWTASEPQTASSIAATGVAFTQAGRESRFLYDDTGQQRQVQRTTRSYDDRTGAIISEREWGVVPESDLAAPTSPDTTDDLLVSTEYVPNFSAWIVQLPWKRSTTLGAGSTAHLIEELAYDADSASAADQRYGDEPTRGLQTGRRQWRSGPNGGEWIESRWEYDGAGNPTAYYAPLAVAGMPTAPPTIAASYDDWGFLDSRHNPLHPPIQYEIDPATGNVSKRLDANGYLQCWEFDGFGRLSGRSDSSSPQTSTTAPCTRIQERYEWLDVGLPDSQHVRSTTWAGIDGNGDEQCSGAELNCYQSFTHFDGLGRIHFAATELEKGVFAQARRQWDSRGNLECEWLPASGGSQAPAAMTDCSIISPPDDGTNRRVFTYDVLDRHRTTSHAGLPLRDTVYAILDHDQVFGLELVEHTTTAGGGTSELPDRYVELGFDNSGRVVSVCNNPNAVGACDASSMVITLARDPLGRITAADGPDVTSPQGTVDINRYEVEYNSLGQRERYRSISDASIAREWQWSYDPNGNLERQVPPNGISDEVLFRYDVLDRPLVRDLPPHNPTSVGAEDIERRYDEPRPGAFNINRLTSETAAGNGRTLDWGLRGRDFSQTWSFQGLTGAHESGTYFDLAGRPEVREYSDGTTVRMQYDAGSPSALYLTDPPATERLVADSILIDATGRLGQLEHIDSGVVLERTYAHAEHGRLSRSKARLGATNLEDLEFDYDLAGNVSCVTNHAVSSQACEQSFEYDGAHRLVRVSDTRSGIQEVRDFGYDEAGNLVRKGPHGIRYAESSHGAHAATKVFFHTYDQPAGQPSLSDPCLGWTVSDWTDSNGDGIPNECQCGDANGDGSINVIDVITINSCIFDPPSCPEPVLCDATNDGECDVADILAVNGVVFTDRYFELSCARDSSTQPLAQDSYTYDYDPSGHVISRKLGVAGNHNYDWTPDGQLDDISGSITGQFAYAADGRRLRATIEGTDRLYPSPGYELNLASGVGKKDLVIGGEPIITVVSDASGTSEMLRISNHVGSVRTILNAAGSVEQQIHHGPFGEILWAENSAGQPISPTQLATHRLFAGQTFDPESTLHYAGARYYDPLIGRFLSPDPLTIGPVEITAFARIADDGLYFDPYAYGLNNPARFTDPTGELVCGGLCIIGALGAAYEAYNVYQEIRSGDTTVGGYLAERGLEKGIELLLKRIPGVGHLASGAGLPRAIANLGDDAADVGSGLARRRLRRDTTVNPNPPAALPTNRPISRSSAQNSRKDEIVREMEAEGFTDIRVDQQQVNAAGERVGINRPDVQGTSPEPRRVTVEIDRSTSRRGPRHRDRILANDPDAEVVLETIDD